jgi:arabinofuranan 3-O-arabinosyltransferase
VSAVSGTASGTVTMSWLRRHSTALSVSVLVLLALLPALSAAPGRMPADSKLYVYLNPGRFLADTPTTFDPRQFAGWVPHQHIAYLWPTGPWFWFFDRIGVPDWVAHRLWIATLMIAAGLGVRWVTRVFGLSPLAALVAALVYQLSPYILPYVSRTSVLLLPWAGLGWIVGCTVLATRHGRWRYPALIALIVFTVGAVNATALAMIIPAPALWLVHTAWRGDATWRRVATTAGKVALASTAVSLWWIAMLVVQGRHGADVLAYSESLESVSFTSTSTEVVRGLGYWLFYIRDAFMATTTASIDHLISVRVILAGFVLVGVCLVGVVTTRWAHRRYVAMLFGVGTILAVGVHPIDDPSPLMSLLVGDREGGLALALRSSTRAVPVLLLGSALGAALLVDALRERRVHLPFTRRRVRSEVALAAVLGLIAVFNLPALRTGGFVDPALERDQDPPRAWLDAAADLDALPPGARVLQLPGTEFGAYRWGYTVDQPLPALTDRALVTRDLLPLGSAPAMDLVFALDDRFQEGIAEPASVSPVARLLGVDTVWVTGDIAYDRFRLARPEIVDDLLTGSLAGDVGLLPPRRFGDPVVMTPDFTMLDEQQLGDPRVGEPIAPVSLVGIADPVPTIRVKTDELVLSGDGAGIVDAAGAGIIDGRELIRYSASLGDDLVDGIGRATRLVVTDTNRDRAHHWRGSQDVTGFTESGGPGSDVLRFEGADQRLPVFETSDPATQTIAIQDGPLTAAASAYGEPFAYLPEHRPVMAIDGDPTTAWTVADRFDATGEFLEIRTDRSIDHVTLRQPDSAPTDRTISLVELTVDDRPPLRVELDERSLTGGGQRIEIEPTSDAATVRITIAATDDPQPPIGPAIGGVGFAEVDVGLGPTTEFIRPPLDGLDATASTPDTPLTMVFTRLRTDPTDRWRSDPEPELRRRFELPREVPTDVAVTIRLDQRATGAVLADLLGENVSDDAHLTGVPAARGAAAFDGDATTSWITPFEQPSGASVTFDGSGGSPSTATSISIDQPGGDTSPVSRLTLIDEAGSVDLTVPVSSTTGEPTTADIVLPRPVSLAGLRIRIDGIEERTTLDRRFAEVVTLPAAISEIRFDESSPTVAASPTITADCRTDLLELDGTAVGVSYEVDTATLLAGEPIDVELCGAPTSLGAGEHELVTTGATSTGLQVDRVTFVEPGADGSAEVLVPDTVSSSSRRHVVEVPACPDGCWIVLGEGFNTAWSATSGGDALGDPQLVDGNANGWYLEPSSTPRTVTMSWTAQRPVTIGLALSFVAVLALLALVVLDRRRRANGDADGGVTDSHPGTATRPGRCDVEPLRRGRHRGVHGRRLGAVHRLDLGTDRRRRAGPCGDPAPEPRRRLDRVTIILGAGAVVTEVVRSERPYPNAGWPIRFEWLHGWTLLGVVLITCATLFADDARSDPSVRE